MTSNNQYKNTEAQIIKNLEVKFINFGKTALKFMEESVTVISELYEVSILNTEIKFSPKIFSISTISFLKGNYIKVQENRIKWSVFF